MICLCYYLEHQAKECGFDSACWKEPLEAFRQENGTEMTTTGSMDCDHKETLEKNIYLSEHSGKNKGLDFRGGFEIEDVF